MIIIKNQKNIFKIKPILFATAIFIFFLLGACKSTPDTTLNQIEEYRQIITQYHLSEFDEETYKETEELYARYQATSDKQKKSRLLNILLKKYREFIGKTIRIYGDKESTVIDQKQKEAELTKTHIACKAEYEEATKIYEQALAAQKNDKNLEAAELFEQAKKLLQNAMELTQKKESKTADAIEKTEKDLDELEKTIEELEKKLESQKEN